MKILVCGGRDYTDKALVYATLDQLKPTHIVNGGATGADWFGLCYARDKGLPYSTYMADWKTYGKAAGPIRNQEMLDKEKPDMVVGFFGGTGTKDMIDRAQRAGINTTHIKGLISHSEPSLPDKDPASDQ